eukprot:CAMPEP_0206439146 /NCGR_PEP_ID=MMETSP0324_2-20121206/12039_1 /ASSEMBLY_ACC=CAM_ASM_000836 /TAXON_ID=2866 /ORGANISM="Crypthecodinium cohnii, Strain Seligo" /LENGTH=148 /DNA_ID=CAMNT_0053906715 /DNA_START=368 /DNA_END=814 /DNA_ORIENTATION=+
MPRKLLARRRPDRGGSCLIYVAFGPLETASHQQLSSSLLSQHRNGSSPPPPSRPPGGKGHGQRQRWQIEGRRGERPRCGRRRARIGAEPGLPALWGSHSRSVCATSARTTSCMSAPPPLLLWPSLPAHCLMTLPTHLFPCCADGARAT